MDGEQGPRDPGWQECVLWGCGEDGTVRDSDLVPGSETGPPHHAKFRLVAHCVKAEVLLDGSSSVGTTGCVHTNPGVVGQSRCKAR